MDNLLSKWSTFFYSIATRRNALPAGLFLTALITIQPLHVQFIRKESGIRSFGPFSHVFHL